MKKFLVYDPSGIFTTHASGLSKGGNEVKFYTPFNYLYRDFCIEKDFEDLKKQIYFFNHVKDADCIVNFDIRNQDLIGFLREQFPNKSVFGSGKAGFLEDDRVLLKEVQGALGLDVQPFTVCTGITQLQKYLKTKKDCYVKINIFREEMESFFCADYDSVELKLDQIADHLGPHKEQFVFVVEDKIDCEVECGCDLFFNGKNYLAPYLFGYEFSKNGYIGKVSHELPKALETTMSAFMPVLEKFKYRGAISTEEFIISQDEHYLIDLCARMASPFTAGYPEWIENWPEVVYGVGKGKFVIPEFKHKYIGAFALKSAEALHCYEKINIKDPAKVKMFSPVGNKKGDYAVMGEDHVAVVIAGGDSVDEVINGLYENAESVDSCDMDKKPLKDIEKIKEIIENGEKVGIKF